MTISIKHKFVNPKSDTGDTTVSRASNWNDEHDITLAQNRVLGRVSAANGPVEELTGEQIRTISETTQAGVLVGINTRTASYTLVASDRGKIVEMNVAGANTVTIPNEAGLGGVNYPVGTQIKIAQLGAGQTTLLPAAGVTVRSVTGGLSTSTRYGALILYKRASNDWFVIDHTSAYLDYRVDALETISGSFFYQGGQASNPSLRNDGTALQTGDLYFNTTNDRMRVYETGTGWIDYEATAQAAATTATTQATTATTQAGTATTQAGIATSQATIATTQAGLASTAKTAAEAARDAALLSRGVFATTAKALSNGVASTASLVGGSAGTNGTFDLAFSGGGGTGAAGRFVVAGGAVTSVLITATGDSYTSAPTISFAASSGLTGASATAVIASNVNVGEWFSVPETNGDVLIYEVTAGPVATLRTSVPAGATFPTATRVSSLLPAITSVDGAGVYQRQRGQGLNIAFDPQQLISEVGRALRSAFPYYYSTPRAPLFDYNMVPITGQSNGGYQITTEPDLNYTENEGGLNGEAVIPDVYRTFNKYGNLMLAGDFSADPVSVTVTPPIALVPWAGTYGEISPRFGIANYGVAVLRQAGGFQGKFIVSNANVGGAAIENLMPGGAQQNASFWRACRQIAQAKIWSNTNYPSATFGVPYIPFIHGESGANGGTSVYASKLYDMWRYINGSLAATPPSTSPTTPASMKAASGQTADIPLYITQHHTNSGVNATLVALNQKQYEAARDYEGIRLIAPTYPYRYRTIDGTHYSAPTMMILGQLFARANAYEVATGQKWQPLQPVTAENTHSGGVITLYMNSPFDANLTFDDVNVPLAASYGFEVFDSGGTALTINSVTLGKRRSVVIAYSGGTASAVAYAQNTAYAVQGNLRTDSLAGTLSQSDDTFGEPLQFFDWCVSFRITV